MSPKSIDVLQIKCITRLLPSHCEAEVAPSFEHYDELLGREVLSIDLGTLFWKQKLDQKRLQLLVHDNRRSSESDSAGLSLDRITIDFLCRAKEISSSTKFCVPSACDMWFAYRTLQRAVEIGTRFESGVKLHMARGLVIEEYNQYSLDEVLAAAVQLDRYTFGRQCRDLLSPHLADIRPKVVVINLRNDGEFNQAVVIAALCRERFRDCSPAIVLDTSDANEQFDFGAWQHPFLAKREKLGQFLDFFLPRQDYKATLRNLISLILNGASPLHAEPNLVTFASATAVPVAGGQRPDPKSQVIAKLRPSLDQAFEHYIRRRPVFKAAGLRTMSARVSPNRCHWAACSFCTINSQHILPRASMEFDVKTRYFAELLIDTVDANEIQSLILMDEALPVEVLIGFAKMLLKRGLKLLYRARARFTSELTEETCKLLYESGLRYLGLGLEAASPRVNRLVNKHMGEPIDYDTVISNLETAGIRSHIYCIMGFPTETRKEIQDTFDLVHRNILRHKYVTVSANSFYLMRGSEIYANPEKFGIQKLLPAGDLALAVPFEEQETNSNRKFVEEKSKQLYNETFLPHIIDPEAAEGFWHFVDQTGIFYLEKVHYSQNPYRIFSKTIADNASSFNESSCVASPYLFRLKHDTDSNVTVYCDASTYNYVELPSWFGAFFDSIRADLPLSPQVRRSLPKEKHATSFKIVKELLKSGMLQISSYRDILEPAIN